MARTRNTVSSSSTGARGKPRTTRNTAATTRQRIPEHERRRQIAEAAYYRAERRGFQGGDPVDDWLVSEAEYDRANGRRTRAKR